MINNLLPDVNNGQCSSNSMSFSGCINDCITIQCTCEEVVLFCKLLLVSPVLLNPSFNSRAKYWRWKELTFIIWKTGRTQVHSGDRGESVQIWQCNNSNSGSTLRWSIIEVNQIQKWAKRREYKVGISNEDQNLEDTTWLKCQSRCFPSC